MGVSRLFVLGNEVGFSPESIFTILSPAFLVALAVVGLGGGGTANFTFFYVGFLPKKDFTESIIPSPYICFLLYFPISGSYFFFEL